MDDVTPMRFRGFDNSVQHSIGAVELEWAIDKHRVAFVAHVVPGNAGLLLSRPDLRALGAILDLEKDKMHLTALNCDVEMRETPAGHCEIDLLGRPADQRPSRPKGQRVGESTVRVLEDAPSFQ